MKDDLADALIPVFWARDHIPVLRERLLNWQRRFPYEVVAERDPVQADMDLVIARLRTPLDPLIIGDGSVLFISLSSLAANFVQASALPPPGTRNSHRIGDLSEQSSCLTRILRRRLLNLFVEFHDAAS
jgi:hypothetical protein